MSSLIVALNPPSSRAGVDVTYATTLDGQAVASHGTVAANLLPPSTELVAVVPARMLSWHHPVIPKAPGNRLAEVLQGALEEQLLDDPASLHFALQPGARALQGSGQPVWVAACDKAWLRGALQALEASGRRVTRVVPEMAPGSGECWVSGTPQSAWCVMPDAHGLAVLPLEASPKPTVPVFAEPAVAALAEKVLGVKVNLRQNVQQLVAAARTDWNLAQFDLVSVGRKVGADRLLHGWEVFARAPQWRAVRWGLGAALAIQFVAINGWAWKENAALSAKRAQLKQTFSDTFPQVKPIVDPVAQMAREVAALQQAVGQATARDLEVMLSQLATALPDGRTPAALEFSTGELKLKGLTLSGAELNTVEARLKEAGYFAFTQDNGLTVRFNAGKGGRS